MKYEIDEFMLEDKKEELECDAEDLWKLAYKNLETKVEKAKKALTEKKYEVRQQLKELPKENEEEREAL